MGEREAGKVHLGMVVQSYEPRIWRLRLQEGCHINKWPGHEETRQQRKHRGTNTHVAVLRSRRSQRPWEKAR